MYAVLERAHGFSVLACVFAEFGTYKGAVIGEMSVLGHRKRVL